MVGVSLQVLRGFPFALRFVEEILATDVDHLRQPYVEVHDCIIRFRRRLTLGRRTSRRPVCRYRPR